MREIKENIVYPARFQTESGGGVCITFPDFPELLVIAGDWQEGMELAQRQLALAVIDRLDSGRELPSVAGPHEAVEGPPAAIPSAELVYLHIWLPYFRSDMREVYVKKSVTIPQWLDLLAKKSGKRSGTTCFIESKEEKQMSEFRDKCANIALGGSTGASVGGAVGAAIGALGGPVTSLTGARIGGALGSLAGMFWD